MSSSVLHRAERRAALLKLQRLLTSAQASFSRGAAGCDETLERLAEAFELFRAQFQSEIDVSEPAPAGDQRRLALLTLARVLLEMDRAVMQGDSEGVSRALENAKTALSVSRALDHASHSSGVRLRPGSTRGN